jgi:cell division protein FtsB
MQKIINNNFLNLLKEIFQTKKIINQNTYETFDVLQKQIKSNNLNKMKTTNKIEIIKNLSNILNHSLNNLTNLK